MLAEAGAEQGFTVHVRGDCMAPLIADNAQVLVRRQRRYWPGDMLVVVAAGGLAVHRMIGCYRRRGQFQLVTQADAAKRPDPANLPKYVLGRLRGGDCAAVAIDVPFHHRVWALGRFFRFVCRRMLDKCLMCSVTDS